MSDFKHPLLPCEISVSSRSLRSTYSNSHRREREETEVSQRETILRIVLNDDQDASIEKEPIDRE